MKSTVHTISKQCYHPDIGLLILRVVTGFIFILEGWQKFQNLHGTQSLMVHLGLPISMAVIIATIELVGGLALIFGIAVRLWGIVFCLEMLGVIFLTGWSRGISSHNLELILAAASLTLMVAGPGRYALYSESCRTCGGMFCTTHTT